MAGPSASARSLSVLLPLTARLTVVSPHLDDGVLSCGDLLAEEASRYFEDCADSPFMLFVYGVRAEMADRVPAIRHVDGTARAQTVSKEQSPRFHALLERFQEQTGVPVLVNTSFNTRGKPVVCTPQDALECFYTSPIDVLTMGGYLLQK